MSKTAKQELGGLGEIFVAKTCSCPRCKRDKTLKCLPPNFKCADIICDFCGYLAQVKSKNVLDISRIPHEILGAAWGPQAERMQAGIYFPLFLVLIAGRDKAVYYLPADFQKPTMFKARKALSALAKRAGWQGFSYDLRLVKQLMARLF